MDDEDQEIYTEPTPTPTSSASTKAANQSFDIGSIIIGLIVVFLGVWLLGSLLKLLPVVPVLSLPWWAAITFFGGLLAIGSSPKAMVPGILLMFVSASYLFRYFGFMADQTFHEIWLVLLILTGLVLVASSRK